jgi:hypothetical protein
VTAYERGYGLGAQVRQAYSNEARVYALEAALDQLLIVTENSSGAFAWQFARGLQDGRNGRTPAPETQAATAA